MTIGIGLFVLTGFGISTYSAYKKTRNHIWICNTVLAEYMDKHDSWYCNRTGVRLAAQDAGLAHIVDDYYQGYILSRDIQAATSKHVIY